MNVVPGVNDRFDLDGNGTINLNDQSQWLVRAASANGLASPYKLGDANLSGEVDGSDFSLWNAGKFTNTLRWDRGNFNGDATVDGSDFGIWNTFKFQASDGQSALPEPHSIRLAVALMVCGLLRRWR